MATQLERRTATRLRITDAAFDLFSTLGYEATSTGMILERAQISRGAMYHHFATKEELFVAVFEQASAKAITMTLRSVNPASTPIEKLVEGSLAWLKTVQDPALRSILLEQGPATLGWQQARKLEAKSSLGIMRASLKEALNAREIEVQSLEMTALILNAAIAEAALAQLNNDHPLTPADAESVIRQIILGLRPD